MEKAKAIHPNTTFALVPELAAQVGYVVEGWTYIERVLRETLIRLNTEHETRYDPERCEELVALELFHIANIRKEIDYVTGRLKTHTEPWAQDMRELLARTLELLDDRNSIIHGWYVGGHNEFAPSLVRFAKASFTSTIDYQQHRKTVDAHAFVSAHIEDLSRLITEAVSILRPSTPAS